MPPLPSFLRPLRGLKCQGELTDKKCFYFNNFFIVFFSCFLLTLKEDSVVGIFETLKQCAVISKSAGGIGLNFHCIRAKGSEIASSEMSDGLIPFLRVFNNTALYVNQGGNKVFECL